MFRNQSEGFKKQVESLTEQLTQANAAKDETATKLTAALADAAKVGEEKAGLAKQNEDLKGKIKKSIELIKTLKSVCYVVVVMVSFFGFISFCLLQ